MFVCECAPLESVGEIVFEGGLLIERIYSMYLS